MRTVRNDDRPGGVRLLTLDRPPANAIDDSLLDALGAACAQREKLKGPKA
jgi:enoyl-CoA hydratase/carnithine racemase